MEKYNAGGSTTEIYTVIGINASETYKKNGVGVTEYLYNSGPEINATMLRFYLHNPEIGY